MHIHFSPHKFPALDGKITKVPHHTFSTMSFSNQPNHLNHISNIPHLNSPDISTQNVHQMMNQPPQALTASSSQQPLAPVDPRSHLPQDILHILESNFTSDSTDSQSRKDQQISRVAEELRVKVRLSRYRRVRDQLSDSEDEDSEVANENETSEDDAEDESEENEDDQNNARKMHLPSDDEADLIDGSGDEEEEREKNNKALAKLKMEIENIIGIPQTVSTIGPLEEIDNIMADPVQAEQKSTQANRVEPQTGVESMAETSQDPQTTISTEPEDLTAEKTLEGDEAVKDLLAKVKSQIDQLNDSSELPSITPSEDPLAICQNEAPLPSTIPAASAEPAQHRSSSPVKPQTAKPKQKPLPKKHSTGPVDSGDESEDEGQEINESMAGPTTANELKEPPSEVVQIPFTRVSDDELRSISPFGSIASLIGNVLVIQGNAGLGYDRVLDEGTLVCQKDGLVVGKIFETFGSVTSPHYSIRLPNHILARAPRNDDEGLNLSPGVELAYLPTHSNFVFTAELRAQPKGTDASNFYDEEVGNADEIEFSDDEAEAAYRRACKLAKKTARDLDANVHHQNHPRARSSAQVSENGRRMFVKMPSNKLNYGADDGDEQPGNGTVESDYSLLERPKDSPASNDTSMPMTNSTNRHSSAQRSRGKKRATGGRDRNRKKFPSQQSHTAPSQPTSTISTNGSAGGPSHIAGNPQTDFRPDRTSGFSNPPSFLPPNPNLNHFQAQTGVQGSMMVAPGNMNMNFVGQAGSNSASQGIHSSPYIGLWNGANGLPMAPNPMMMSMMMNQNAQPQLTPGIPSYNPHLPSPSSNQMFQFGFPNPSLSSLPSSQHISSPQNSPSNPSFQFHPHPQFQNIHIPHARNQNNQSAYPPPSTNNPNLGQFNPWFYRPP